MSNIKTILYESPLYPVLILESWVSSSKRQAILKFSGLLLGLFIFLTAIVTAFNIIPGVDKNLVALLAPRVWGILFISLAFYLVSKMIEAYFNSSYYFDNVAQNKYKPGDLFTFTVGRILLSIEGDEILPGFLRSSLGLEIMARCGVTESDIGTFLANHKNDQNYQLPLSNETVLKLRELVVSLYEEQKDFKDFLYGFGIKKDELVGAINWVVRGIESAEYRKRWWWEENLKRVPGLAKDWGFGNTFTLDKYCWDLLFGSQISSADHDFSSRKEELSQIEEILSKDREANALVVAESNQEAMDVIWHLVRNIREKEAPPAVAFRRPMLLNTGNFLAQFKERTAMEQELLKMLNEAAKAGNILLVIDNFPLLLSGLENLGSNFLSLVDHYLTANLLLIVGLADSDTFHRKIEPNAGLMTRFDRIFIRPMPEESIVRSLEEAVLLSEKRNSVFFTYPAILAIAHDAEYYFSESNTGDKAVDLLSEIVPWTATRGIYLIGKKEVEEFVEGKTSIPLGEISPEEKEKLIGLEENLHKRVVGQEEALKAISNAIRRSRTGIRNPKRPIGSFLFLGPTGVGKTETSKALAEVFFGNEKDLLRLDMSEYQGADALAKLIGSFGESQAGVLSNLMREHPYGVLLLDEFEKSNKDILNLFLQVFDEGFFSDMSGKKVNVRNLIFIATSNAGADMLWQAVREGQKPEATKIIDAIVNQGIYKPELLNRFDAVVVFNPLTSSDLLQISKLLLDKLSKRLSEQGIELAYNDYVLKAIATLGANEVFGARPMIRFIQDNVEQPIADKIIKGEIKSGFHIDLKLSAPGETGLLQIDTRTL